MQSFLVHFLIYTFLSIQITRKCGIFWFSFWSTHFFLFTFFTTHVRKSARCIFHLVGQYIVSSVHLKVIANWVHLFILPLGRFVRCTGWNFRYQGTEDDCEIALIKNITSKPLLEPSPWLPCMYACSLQLEQTRDKLGFHRELIAALFLGYT